MAEKTSGHIEIFDVRGEDAVMTGQGYDYATAREARAVWDQWKTVLGVTEGRGQFRIVLYLAETPIDAFEVTDDGFRQITGTNPDTPSIYAGANAEFWTAHAPSTTIRKEAL